MGPTIFDFFRGSKPVKSYRIPMKIDRTDPALGSSALPTTQVGLCCRATLTSVIANVSEATVSAIFDLLDLLGQPSAGVGPIAFSGALGEAEHFRRLMVGNSREEPQFDQFRANMILDRQLFQGIADEEQRLIVALGRHVDLIKVYPLPVAAVLLAGFLAGALHEDAPHRLGRRREEMPAVLPRLFLLANKPKISFMNESGGLQSLARRLASHPPRSKLAQFFVDQRKQFVCSLWIAPLNAVEDARDVAHARRLCHRHGMGNLERKQQARRGWLDLQLLKFRSVEAPRGICRVGFVNSSMPVRLVTVVTDDHCFKSVDGLNLEGHRVPRLDAKDTCSQRLGLRRLSHSWMMLNLFIDRLVTFFFGRDRKHCVVSVCLNRFRNARIKPYIGRCIAALCCHLSESAIVRNGHQKGAPTERFPILNEE